MAKNVLETKKQLSIDDPTNFLSMGCHYGPEMLESMYKAFSRPIYSSVETTAEPIRIVSVHHDGFQIIVRDKDEFSHRHPRTFASGHKRSIRRLALWDTSLKPGPQIISISFDSTIKVFDFEGKMLRTMEGHVGAITCISVSKNDNYEDTLIVTGGIDKTIRYWNIKTGKLKQTLLGHNSDIVSLAFIEARGDNPIIVASIDKLQEIRLWNRFDGTCLRRLNPSSTILRGNPTSSSSSSSSSSTDVVKSSSSSISQKLKDSQASLSNSILGAFSSVSNVIPKGLGSKIVDKSPSKL